MFDALSTLGNGISLCIYEWVTFLEAKSGVWEMKWFLTHKIESLSCESEMVTVVHAVKFNVTNQ